MQGHTEKIRFILNQSEIEERIHPGVVLLDYLRNQCQTTGTRAACREGDCGSCMVLMGEFKSQQQIYHPANACLLPMGLLIGRHIVTIEGLQGERLNPIQQALVDAGAVQCGYCMPGLVMALTAFFLNTQTGSVNDALDAVAGNLCRCSGYMGIKRALTQLCEHYKAADCVSHQRIQQLVEWQILPDYFLALAPRLSVIDKSKILTDQEQVITIGGGSDLLVQQPEQLLTHTLAFTKQDQALCGIEICKQMVTVGAAISIEALRNNALMASISAEIQDDFKMICSDPIRQQATVGGNLVNASPIGDLSVFFLALDATLHIESNRQSRQIALRNFFKAYKQTDLQKDERLIAISFELPKTPDGFSYEKVSKRRFLDIASVNSAFQIQLNGKTIESAHLSAGGVAAFPLYLAETSRYLQGKPATPETLHQALNISQSEISPISDIRGSADYKRFLLRQLITAHFLKLCPKTIQWEAIQ